MFKRSRPSVGRRIFQVLMVVGGSLTVGGVVEAVRARARKRPSPIMFSVTINKPPAEVFAAFRALDRLPTFMHWLETVHERPDGTSHWVAKLIGGKTVAWDARIIEERRDEVIAWQTEDSAPLPHGGRVTFARAPGRDSTEVRVAMTVGKGAAGVLLAKILAKPQIKGDLRRFKQIMETGEVVKSDASIHAGPHPAQPSEARVPAPVRVADADFVPVATSSTNHIAPPSPATADGHGKHEGAQS